MKNYRSENFKTRKKIEKKLQNSWSAWSCRRWSYGFDKVKKYSVRLGLKTDCARNLDLPVVLPYIKGARLYYETTVGVGASAHPWMWIVERRLDYAPCNRARWKQDEKITRVLRYSVVG